MAIEIPKAIAICSDCACRLEGEMNLDASLNIYWDRVGEARGDILIGCAEHHDINRLPGTTSEYEAPQHDHFYIQVEGKNIGSIGPVSSMAAITRMDIGDDGWIKKFREEVLEPLQQEEGRRRFMRR